MALNGVLVVKPETVGCKYLQRAQIVLLAIINIEQMRKGLRCLGRIRLRVCENGDN